MRGEAVTEQVGIHPLLNPGTAGGILEMCIRDRTIVVITSGGSVDVSPWKDKVEGILACWYAGEEGGLSLIHI